MFTDFLIKLTFYAQLEKLPVFWIRFNSDKRIRTGCQAQIDCRDETEINYNRLFA